VAVPSGAHRLTQSRIIPVAAMVDEFVETTQNTNKTQLLASNYSYGTN